MIKLPEETIFSPLEKAPLLWVYSRELSEKLSVICFCRRCFWNCWNCYLYLSLILSCFWKVTGYFLHYFLKKNYPLKEN